LTLGGCSFTFHIAFWHLCRSQPREPVPPLQTLDDLEIPLNLRMLYLRMPSAFAVRYWRRMLASPREELWFGAHTRAAPDEMHALARELGMAVRRAGRPTPYLDTLVPEQ
jgi:2-dehydropantoate 2-reductase